jgi:hypothetical protein
MSSLVGGMLGGGMPGGPPEQEGEPVIDGNPDAGLPDFASILRV